MNAFEVSTLESWRTIPGFGHASSWSYSKEHWLNHKNNFQWILLQTHFEKHFQDVILWPTCSKISNSKTVALDMCKRCSFYYFWLYFSIILTLKSFSSIFLNTPNYQHPRLQRLDIDQSVNTPAWYIQSVGWSAVSDFSQIWDMKFRLDLWRDKPEVKLKR